MGLASSEAVGDVRMHEARSGFGSPGSAQYPGELRTSRPEAPPTTTRSVLVHRPWRTGDLGPEKGSELECRCLRAVVGEPGVGRLARRATCARTRAQVPDAPRVPSPRSTVSPSASAMSRRRQSAATPYSRDRDRGERDRLDQAEVRGLSGHDTPVSCSERSHSRRAFVASRACGAGVSKAG
jgi:hypothetical protein